MPYLNKGLVIQETISDYKIDLLAVTETWIHDNSPDYIKNCAVPEGFKVIRTNRTHARGNKAVHYSS